MNKRELIRNVTDLLQDNGTRKSISIPKQTFHISDDEGNSKDFTVRKTDGSIAYSYEDVDRIVNACLYIICEKLKQGETISIQGFGSLGLKYRKPRSTKKINSDERIKIEGRYIPKFSFGNDLRLAAKMYELSIDEKMREAQNELDRTKEIDDFINEIEESD